MKSGSFHMVWDDEHNGSSVVEMSDRLAAQNDFFDVTHNTTVCLQLEGAEQAGLFICSSKFSNE